MNVTLKEKKELLAKYSRSVGKKYSYINDLFRNHKRPDPSYEDFKGVARCLFPEILGNTAEEVAKYGVFLQDLEKTVARQMEHTRLLLRKIKSADRETIEQAYDLVRFSMKTIERREDIDASYVLCDLTLYAVSATQVYDIFEEQIIRNNGFTADFEFFKESLNDGIGNAIIVGRNIPNYIRADIYLTTDRDFSTANQLLKYYRALEDDEEFRSINRMNHRWVVRVIPKIEDFIIQSREHRLETRLRSPV